MTVALRLACASLLACLAIGACETPRPVSSRVNPGYLDKVDFIPAEFSSSDAGPQGGPGDEPGWFARTSVLGGIEPFGVSLLPRYRGTRTVRWDVTEGFLVARDITDGVAPDGTYPVYGVFRIESHFDIADPIEYRTGEPCLLATCPDPNAPPWYQRRLMNVDLSQDLIDRQFGSGPDVELLQDPIPHYSNGPTDPEIPRFWCGSAQCGLARDAASLGLTRIAITSHVFVHAQTSDGGVPGDASADAQAPAIEVSLLTEFSRQPL